MHKSDLSDTSLPHSGQLIKLMLITSAFLSGSLYHNNDTSAISDIKATKGIALSFKEVWKRSGLTMMASGAVAALTAITAIVGAVKQYYRELDQSTANAAQSYAQTNSGIESQISEITRLKTALDEGSLSEQEAYNAKSQLYDIQKNLASSYGEQARGIDLVNGKLEEQTALIRKNIQADEARSYRNENVQGIDRAIKRMEATREYELGSIYDSTVPF
ncbi:MAG: hypothetical protein PUD66_03940 [Oscillospiraceae bacterium]|nr:hypothetical protein [Oscillospiraceae bacterium]